MIKLILFLIGYIGAMAVARELSHTFNVLLGSLFDWFRLGLVPGAALLVIAVGLLLFSIWRTKPTGRQEPAFLYWRKLDFSLIVLAALYFAFFLLFTAHTNWTELGVFLLPLLAYAVIALTLAELVARLRDKDLLRSLYWLRFFRAYPIWQPLGLLFAVLLVANLLLLLLAMPEVARFFRLSPSFGLHILIPTAHGRWWVDLVWLMRALSALSLATLTYFAAVLLNLAAKHEEANAEKVRAERFKSELITNVSHDIRTPLTSIVNYVDLLKSQPLQGEAAEYVAVLDRKAQRLDVLITDLLEASKAGTGNVSVELDKINLTELVGQIAGEFDGQFNARGLTLVLRGPDEPVLAQADSRHLWRTLENLFSNAAKYALPGTRVFAEITQGDAETGPTFTLKNTSHAPIDLLGEALTEQFIRGDRARQTEGSGLGLYIAKSLVELMSGQFNVNISGDLFEVEIAFPPDL